MSANGRVTVGFPRMHCEPNERRDFLPPLIGLLAATGAEVHVESGIGSGMGRTDVDYSVLSPSVVVTDEADAYRQDIVVVLRAPDGKYDKLRRGAILVSMLHFATRPARVRLLQEMGIDAVSLDLIRDDDGADSSRTSGALRGTGSVPRSRRSSAAGRSLPARGGRPCRS